MVGISRVRLRAVDNGYVGDQWINGAYTLRSQNPTYERCEDVVGNPLGQNRLWLQRYESVPCIASGGTGIGVGKYLYRNTPIGSNIVPGHLSLQPYRDATQAIAAHHPGEPGVSIPNFLYELKDVPGMLRHAADRARRLHEFWLSRRQRVSHSWLAGYYSRRHIGEDWLNYQFGWLPFFSDLNDILGLSAFLERRRKQFKSMRGNELRVSGTLGSDSAETCEKQILISQGTVVYSMNRTRTIGQSWYAARYAVDPIRFGAALSGNKRDQLTDFLGWGTDLPIQIWDAMPWTWLSDWFFNVDGILAVMGNRQGVKFSSAVVMTKTVTNRTFSPISPPKGLVVTDGHSEVSLKQRDIFVPTFIRTDAGFNIFQPSHLATLAALKVTKGSGSSSF